MSSDERYRLWLAGDTEWQAGPVFPHLALAIDKARRLAVTRWVAIELPSREWHVFDESKTTRLGPPQFARGSNLDLNDQAAHASVETEPTQTTPTPDPKPASQTKTKQYTAVRGGSSSYRVANIRNTGRFMTTPRTNAGVGPVVQPAGSRGVRLGSSDPEPDDSERTSEQPTRRTSKITPAQRARRASSQRERRISSLQRSQPSTQPPIRGRRRPSPSTAREENERRGSERFAAEDVLGEPACYVDGERVDVINVSETGLQLMAPARVRLRLGNPVVLAFSDNHGRFDLVVRVVWSRNGYAGVQIEDGPANLVGKMFLRKLIGQLVSRRKRRPSAQRRTR